MTIERLELGEANAFVRLHHRHHRPVIGHLFSIGAALDGAIVGVAIIGRPVARGRDDGVTAEITRLATDGSGPGARMMDLEWARTTRDNCRKLGIKFFFKQTTGKKAIPPDLMVREFPR